MPIVNATVWRVLTDPKVNDKNNRVGVLVVSPESASKDREGNAILDSTGNKVYPDGVMAEAVAFSMDGRPSYAFDALKNVRKGQTLVLEGRISSGAYYTDTEGRPVDVSRMGGAERGERVKAGTLKKNERLEIIPFIVWGVIEDTRGGGSNSSGSSTTSNTPSQDDTPSFLKDE